MTDSDVLKPVFGKLYADTSYKVIFRTDEGTFGMYVWAEDSDEAIRIFSERYDIKNKYLYATRIPVEEEDE